MLLQFWISLPLWAGLFQFKAKLRNELENGRAIVNQHTMNHCGQLCFSVCLPAVIFKLLLSPLVSFYFLVVIYNIHYEWRRKSRLTGTLLATEMHLKIIDMIKDLWSEMSSLKIHQWGPATEIVRKIWISISYYWKIRGHAVASRISCARDLSLVYQ